jgi:hypothetical protein
VTFKQLEEAVAVVRENMGDLVEVCQKAADAINADTRTHGKDIASYPTVRGDAESLCRLGQNLAEAMVAAGQVGRFLGQLGVVADEAFRGQHPGEYEKAAARLRKELDAQQYERMLARLLGKN